MKATIWIVIVLLPFFNFFIVPNISFADIGLLIGCVSLFFHNKKSIFVLSSAENRKLIFLLIWVLFSSFLFVLDTSNNYIKYLTIVTSHLRFFMILYLFFNLRFFFRNNYLLNYLIRVWVYVIYFICFLAFIEYSLQFFGIYYSYYFEGITTTTGRSLKESFRISSIFNEPSYLVIYLNFSLLVILEFIKKNIINSKLKLRRLLIIIFLTTLVAKSLVGFVLVLILILVYRDLILSNLFGKNSLKVYFIFSLASGLVFISNMNRIEEIYKLEDGSANHRLLGAWELNTIIFEGDNFIKGVGLGQHKNFLIAKAYSFKDHWFMDGVSTNSGINNMFLLILVQTGIVGLFLYLYFLYNTFRSRKGLFLFFLISGFGWAYTFNPLYWFCISILHIIINGRKKNLIHLH